MKLSINRILLCLIFISQLAIIFLLLDKPRDSRPYEIKPEYNTFDIKTVYDFNTFIDGKGTAWDIKVDDEKVNIESFKATEE